VLSSVATLRRNDSTASIERRDRERFVAIKMGLAGRTLGKATRDVVQLPAMRQLPPNVRQLPAGDVERVAELLLALAGGW